MDEESFNISLRKFLKFVGVSSQREIEAAVRKALESGALKGDESLATTMTLEIPALQLRVPLEGQIDLT